MLNKSIAITPYSYDYWLQKNWYYHSFLARFYQWMVPAQNRVLQVGCKSGYLLHAVNPKVGVGIEFELESLSVAQSKYPQYQFYGTLKEVGNQQFDYIILSSVCMEVEDIQNFLESLHPFCNSNTRIIFDIYSFWWEPILRLAQLLGFRRPTTFANWIALQDMKNLFILSNFDVITSSRCMLIPIYIPLISWVFNRFIAQIPIINRFCLIEWLVARPQIKKDKDYSVSVIVTCKNEAGNIASIIESCPQMGSSTELIFAEGGSSDGTYEEISRLISLFPQKKIRLFKQDGKGKGDAVRKGFANAQGEILMILDGDHTMPAYELPKFYHALVTRKGDFINGSRLVYGMESEAMRLLNVIANYLFGIGFSWVLGQPIKDTLCGTKVLFKKDWERIVQNRSCFGEFDPFGDFDLLFGAAKLHLKIIDMPVNYKARTYGTSQIRRFHAGILLLRMCWFALFKFKLRA